MTIFQKYILSYCTCIVCCLNLNAQEIDSTIKNTVIIYQDPRLEALNDRPAAVLKYIDDALKAEKPIEKPKEKTEPVYDALHAGNKTVTGSIKTVDGYRVQIYNGPSREIAMAAKSTFDKRYPTIRSYLAYNTPRYKIKVGNFETKKEAEKFLKQIISIVPAASVVPDIVTVKNILVR
jgi:inorganic pyrophosphatase